MFETDSTVVSRAGDANVSAHTARNIILRTEGRLTLWDLEKDELQTIVEADVIKYSLSQDGLKLVFAQSAGNGQPVFHLIFIDLETGTQRMLQENMRCLHNFEIAPDGSKLFFIAAEWDPQAELCEPAKRRNGQHFAETFSVN
ncbi:MAG: hypothetical protein KDE09_22405, partial [Anaerolineales bacterium]|nr:hypothetical protein [Anaerolineales bacterium]